MNPFSLINDETSSLCKGRLLMLRDAMTIPLVKLSGQDFIGLLDDIHSFFREI